MTPHSLTQFASALIGAWLAAGTAAQTAPEQLLLKDYRPRSIYRIPETRTPKARFPAIDMHSHAYANNDEEVARWVQVMDQVGVEKSIVMTGATGAKFDELIARYRKHPGRFSVWCGFDSSGYDQPGYGPAAAAELERCFRAGAEGVGELGDKGKGLFYGEPKAWGMHIDDPRMDPLLEKCAELGLPINIHVAEPIWMYESMDEHNDGLMNAFKWRLDNQTNILGHTAMVGTLERALQRHPRTTFIACHFANCCYDLARLGALLDRHSNLSADIAARFAETATIPRYMGEFFQRYQDRLLYGTDMGFDPRMYETTFRILETRDEHFYAWHLFSYHWPLHGFGLSEGVLKKVYRENALKLLRKTKARPGS